MKRNTNVVTFGGEPVTLLGKMIKSGSHAKNFIVIDSEMKPVSLSDFQGKIKILSSVASIDNSVCAEQTRRFNQEVSKLEEVQVISISCDLPYALKRFRFAEGIDKILTVSDHRENDFGIKYGLLIEEYRLLARGVVIIDQFDMVKYVEVVKDLDNHPDYDAALTIAKKLS